MINLPVLRSRFPVGSSAKIIVGSLAKRAGDRHALLLTPDISMGFVHQAVAKLHALQNISRLCPVHPGVLMPAKIIWQHHVFQAPSLPG